jgi:hypothetical protein
MVEVPVHEAELDVRISELGDSTEKSEHHSVEWRIS